MGDGKTEHKDMASYHAAVATPYRKFSKQLSNIYDNVFKYVRTALGWGLFPTILYIGMHTEPNPSFLDLLHSWHP